MRRRAFVVRALILGGAAGTGLWPAGCRRQAEMSAPELAALLPDEAAVVNLGESYLQAHPAERDLEALLAALRETDPGALLSAEAGPRLQRLVRDDYMAGRTVRLSGWVLSVTEARLCALVALLERDAA